VTTYPTAGATTRRRVDRPGQWFRVATRFDGTVMTIEVPAGPPAYVAYFERFRGTATLAAGRLRARGARQRRLVSVRADVDELIVRCGRGSGLDHCSPHPGETMAEWSSKGCCSDSGPADRSGTSFDHGYLSTSSPT